ncbi:MAG: hypothetical protein LBG59_00880 [Candidatus Peribacteria bacterium]|jgi:hypothetical protein|nr:hypothetical protein [Candidatus Peribacteria bacterium]
MKNLVLMTLVALMGVVATNNANAQDNVNVGREPVKLSGNVMFMSMTNSTLTGGFFSQNPALRGMVTASYRDFSFTMMRNSDLLDATTGANVFAFLPSYTKVWGNWSFDAAVEVDVFDYTKDLNLIAPEVTITRKGVVNIDLFLCYARTFTSQQDIYIVRPTVSKTYQGFTFRVYAWYVKWGNDRISFAGEISKEIVPKLRVSVFMHFNNVNLSDRKEFGAVRLGYSF